MARTLSLALVIAVAVSLAACSPFGTSSAGPAPTHDDGGPPSSGVPDGSTPRFCASAHTLCDDFDVGEIGGRDRWTSTENLGAFTLSTDAPVSPPNALSVTSDPGAERASFRKHLDRSATSVHCELDLQVDGPLATGARVDVFHLLVAGPGTPADAVFAILVLSDRGFALTGRVESHAGSGEPLDELTLGQVPVPARWVHVRATHDPKSGKSSFEVSGVGNKELTWPSPLDTVAAIEIELGAIVGGGGPFHLRFDNVACDATP